eukprot:sb/3471944/
MDIGKQLYIRTFVLILGIIYDNPNSPNSLPQGQHENVVHVREIVVGSNMDKIYIVMDYVEHDLKALMENMTEPFLIGEGFQLLNRLLCYDPTKRITGAEAEEHGWFKEEPLPVDPSMFPTWPAKSEMNANPKKKQKSPTPPSGGGAANKLENSGFKFLSALQGSSAKGSGFTLKF